MYISTFKIKSAFQNWDLNNFLFLFQDIKDGVKEVKAELKEHVKHLPDGHRGSIASVTERPSYKPIHQDDVTDRDWVSSSPNEKLSQL